MFFEKNYEYYMDRVEYCETMAHVFELDEDKKMETFYHNAAEGFRIKAQNLKLKDA